MTATTVKIDGAILKDLREIKRADQNLSSLIRELLQSELRRRKMAHAAQEYASFVRENPSEYQEMNEWATASLDQDTGHKKS